MLRILGFRTINVIRISRNATVNIKKLAASESTNARSIELSLGNYTRLGICRTFSSINEHKNNVESTVDGNTYERVCSETLDALCDYFEELTENAKTLTSSDVTYGDGVLTVNLGKEYGTYVINRQTPNKQIWLSSPTSGPKRYDFVAISTENGRWIYKHNGESLHELLQREIKEILKEQSVDFSRLPYGS